MHFKKRSAESFSRGRSTAVDRGRNKRKKNLRKERERGIEHVTRAVQREYRCEWNTCTVSHLSEKFIVVTGGASQRVFYEYELTRVPSASRECVIERIVGHFSHANARRPMRDGKRGKHEAANFFFGPLKTPNLDPFKFKCPPPTARPHSRPRREFYRLRAARGDGEKIIIKKKKDRERDREREKR